jgi:hypothetical protein
MAIPEHGWFDSAQHAIAEARHLRLLWSLQQPHRKQPDRSINKAKVSGWYLGARSRNTHFVLLSNGKVQSCKPRRVKRDATGGA